MTTEAIKREWTVTQLATRVRALNAAAAHLETNAARSGGKSNPLLKPNRGTIGVHRIAKVEGFLVVDLGFANYFDLSPSTGLRAGDEQAVTVKAGELVTLDGNGRIAPAEGATKADLFNYRVELIKVVDGDTLWVKIYLWPRSWIKQKLRLRGLDCPELSTPEGQAAKRFVDALMAKTTAITINTTKPDKYDRYLADVFLELSDQLSAISSQPSIRSTAGADRRSLTADCFLNNALLENGHAVRKDSWQFGDWEPDLL